MVELFYRHKDIAKMHTEVILKVRAAIKEHSIFSLDILNDSYMVINFDEPGLQLCPKSNKLLEQKKKNEKLMK